MMRGTEQRTCDNPRGLRKTTNCGLCPPNAATQRSPRWTCDEGKMKRLLAVVAVATACVALVQPALAQEMGTPDFLTGGSPTNRSYQFFSGGYAGTISRTTVTSPGSYAPGSIFINTAERRLYLILENGQALRYGIGVGRDGFRWAGVHKRTIRSARARCISARRSIASMARTSRRPSVRPYRPAASA
jgi:lipoprotein-anchoring transpeptidase ErfK/SrfK